MIKVEIEINGRKVKIQADNAQDIADAVKVLAEKEKEYVPVYPYQPPFTYPYDGTSAPWPRYPVITCCEVDHTKVNFEEKTWTS